MNDDLKVVLESVGQIGRRSRRLILCRAMCLFTMVMLIGLSTLVAFDYGLHRQSGYLIWVPFAGFLCLLSVAIARFILPAEQYRPSELLIALRIEANYPEIGQRLSTVCDLAQQKDLSPIQQQFLSGLAAQVRTELTQVEGSRCFRPRVVLKPLLLMLGLFIVLGTLVAIYPQHAVIATQRVTMPWMQQVWPRDVELRVLDYRKRAAIGADYEIAIRNLKGALPNDLTLEIQWGDRRVSEFVDLEHDGQLAKHQLVNLLESFRFRLSGGDFQDIGWNTVELVAAPGIRESKLVVVPPEYTGLSPYTTDDRVRALLGSQLEFHAILDEPVERARLMWDVQGRHSSFELDVSRSDESFQVALKKMPLEESGMFWLEFEDRDNVISQSREIWQIDVVEDQTPSVQIQKPNRQSLLAATGKVALAVQVSDDVFVQQVELLMGTPSDFAAHNQLAITLDQQALLVTPRLPMDSNRVFLQHQSDDIQLEGVVDISTLPQFSVGGEVELRVVAHDQNGNQTTSAGVVLSVVSDRELRGQLEQQLNDVQSGFRQVQALFKRMQSTLADLRTSESNSISDHTTQIKVELTHIQSLLLGTNSSIVSRLDRLRSVLELSQINASLLDNATGRMEQLATVIQSDYVPDIQAGVFLAQQQRLAKQTDWRNGLLEVDDVIQRVVDDIDSVLGKEAAIASQTEFEVAWKAMIIEQQNLRQTTTGLATDLLIGNQLKVAERLQENGQRQFELSNAVFQLLEKVNSNSDFKIATAVQDEIRTAVTQMREAAVQLRQRNPLKASHLQNVIIERLQNVLVQLGIDPGQHEQTADRQARQLTEQLKNMYRRQIAVMVDTKESASELVINQQRILSEESDRFSSRPFLSALLRISLNDLAMLQKQAADNLLTDIGRGRQVQEQCVGLLEVMIGVAAEQTQDADNDSDDTSDSKKANVDNLALVTLLQTRLHSELTPLLKLDVLSAGQQKQMVELISKQQQILAVIELMQQAEQERGQGNE